MRGVIGILAVLLLAAPAMAHPPAGGEPYVDVRPQYLKDWEVSMERRLTIHPEPWEMVWPQAWIPLVQDAKPPMSTAEVHHAITRVAWRAYGTLNMEVLRLEQQERDQEKACAETVAKNAAMEASCSVPCRGVCPSGLTDAEREAQSRRARIEMARRKMAMLDELARVSQSRLEWKRSQGEEVDKPGR